jgi:dihydropteroate synthase
MGVLNVTPDSFYDGGRHNQTRQAVDRAREMIQQGVDVIDVGGESTRPGAETVPGEEEIDRVVPVVRHLLEETEARISVDTRKPKVAREALSLGAEFLNVVTGFENRDMIELAADAGCHIVIMHMQGTPQTMQDDPSYDNVVEDVKNYLRERAREAREVGVSQDKIILDPGIGFGKKLDHNRQLLAEIRSLKELGYPVLVGHSRKSFLGQLLGLEVEERGSATLAVSAELIHQGVDVLRVHDVGEHVQLRSIHHWLTDERNDEI